ncbi:hypothetical protein M199_gp281 [Halogranum tailed virus 1]|uniref:Uncharacterized protein n=1 Tax=Halogranum tailed virus 1 TaxID=1273749 RepID=R4T924_9CAUD|nr:hypothetical protein M199_gp281 [Halogranum tailed virus 1]AGM11385.1 hypothetical protein HGTV1_56 [Halogranum tailed virus 1]
MSKRNIEKVTHEDDLEEELGVCFSRDCSDDAEYELQQTYEGEPDKTFYVDFCEDCLFDYTKKVDNARIFGYKDESQFKVN